MVEFRSDMDVQLINAVADDATVVLAARVSTQGDAAAQERLNKVGDRPGLINYLMRERHGSPFEHNMMTFRIKAPLFVFREFQRHRIASYNEESGRYRQLESVFYVPGPERKLVQTGKPGHYIFEAGSQEQHDLVTNVVMENSARAYAGYEMLLEAGVAREVARSVLPLNLYSSMYVTMNARSLMNFLSLRVGDVTSAYPSNPQREIEMVAELMETHFAILMPLTHAAFVAGGRVAP